MTRDCFPVQPQVVTGINPVIRGLLRPLWRVCRFGFIVHSRGWMGAIRVNAGL